MSRAKQKLIRERDHVECKAVDLSEMYIEQAPPARIVAFITMFTSTLDMLADIIMCFELAYRIPQMTTEIGVQASYCYWFFTFIAIFIYIVEMVDVFQTLKYDEENMLLARWAKSLLIALEEVPLSLCLYVLITNEKSLAISHPAMIVAWIKLIALTWGVTKFIKLRFCYPCLPCTMHNDFGDNVNRCCTEPTCGRLAMVLVNVSHLFSIVIVIMILMATMGREEE